jgi:hypothetical protein
VFFYSLSLLVLASLIFGDVQLLTDKHDLVCQQQCTQAARFTNRVVNLQICLSWASRRIHKIYLKEILFFKYRKTFISYAVSRFVCCFLLFKFFVEYMLIFGWALLCARINAQLTNPNKNELYETLHLTSYCSRSCKIHPRKSCVRN